MTAWAYYSEFDPHAAAWLRNLIKMGMIAPGEVDERDIREVQPDDLRGFTQCHFFAGIGVWSYSLRRAGWPDSKPVWTGSCPCQGFSAAGRQRGFEDERHLWPDWYRLISARRPPVVFGEQVQSSLIVGKARDKESEYGPYGLYDPDRDAQIPTAWYDLVCADLEKAVYAVGVRDTPAAGVGAPHIRQRLFFVAQRLEHSEGDGRDERWAEPSRRGVADGRGLGRVADNERDRRYDWRGIDQRSRDADARGKETIRGVSGGEAEKRSLTRRMADNNIDRCSEESVDGFRDEEHHFEPRRHASRMADAEGEGGCGRQSLQERRHDQFRGPDQIQSDGRPGLRGMGDTGSERRERRETTSSGHDVDGATPIGSEGQYGSGFAGPVGVSGDSPGPTNGFWRDADWLLCRDGKWRPVESIHVVMAHGASGDMDRGSTYKAGDKRYEVLRGLREAAQAQAMGRQVRSSGDIQQQEVLRSELHGESLRGADQSSEREEQSSTISESCEDGLRAVRVDGEAARPSSGREPDEQLTLELDDIVRLLSPSCSLAELHGRREDAEVLRALQRTIYEEGPLSHPSQSPAEIWSSLGEEAKSRIRMGFDASRWRLVVPFPLIDGAEFRGGSGSPFEGKSRQEILKGAGNAIVSEVAISFIEDYLEATGQIIDADDGISLCS